MAPNIVGEQTMEALRRAVTPEVGSRLRDDQHAARMQAGRMGMFLIADAITAADNRFRNLLSPHLW
ncbi:hypothetical protein [Rhodococcus ruber]|uniref:hypothetical protein n=1 Tax=Rhodococcus ruber TaxID=1830 RepID=UPI000A8E57DB|nr:hypothetical protein [Rhodococcus ruber]MDO2380088.1 hypothetical protein [Rhodococcus ruber]